MTAPQSRFTVLLTDADGSTHGVVDEITTEAQAAQWAVDLVRVHYVLEPERKRDVDNFVQRLRGKPGKRGLREYDDALGCTVEIT